MSNLRFFYAGFRVTPLVVKTTAKRRKITLKGITLTVKKTRKRLLLMKDYPASYSNNSHKKSVPLDKLRILLWDIDGTLMRSNVRGNFKKYFSVTMNEIFGSQGTLDEITPSGMTDTQIMYEALKDDGFKPEQIMERKTKLLEVFEMQMSKIVENDNNPYHKFNGADEILAKTDKNPIFINSLLTGNLSVAAKIKLSKVGLWHYFENSPNAFGEISHKREDLAIEAGKLFSETYDFNFDSSQFIVIGDTPNDIKCARAFGAKIISVATGRNHPAEELAKLKPDFVLENLENTEKVLNILENL